MNVPNKFSTNLAANCVKSKTIKLQNKEFKISVNPNNKKTSISPQGSKHAANKGLKARKSPKTLINSPVHFNSYNLPDSRFTPHHLTPTPSGYFPPCIGRRSSVCLKIKVNENQGRNSAFGGSILKNDSAMDKVGVSDLYSINGNLLFGSVERNVSPSPTPLKTCRQQKNKKKLKKTKSSFNFRNQQIKIPKLALEIKQITSQVKLSRKKQLSVVT